MGLEHVETIVANNQATVDFTDVFDESADRYLIFIDNVLSDATGDDDSHLSVRTSSDGGSSWDSGGSDYAHSLHNANEDGSTTTNGFGSNDEIRWIINNFSGNIEDTAMAMVLVHDPHSVNDSTVLMSKFVKYDNDSSASFQSGFSGGQRLAQSSIDSIRFYLSDSRIGNNIVTGIFSVYKVTQTTGGAKDHIQTIEADNQSSVDFTDVFASDDGYDRYQIYCDNIIPVSRSESLQARVSSDGGGVWDSGSSDYAWSMFYSADTGDTSTSGSSEDSKMGEILHALGSEPSNNDTSQSKITVSNPTNQNRATALRTSFSRYDNESGRSYLSGYSGGIRLTQSAIDSIQFFMDSGDIASGTFSVYGIGE